MTPETDAFNAGLNRMGLALRRGHAAFNEADDAFIEALHALEVLTRERGSIQAQFDALNETVAELKRLVLEQGEIIKAQGQEIRALRERLNGHR